MKFGGVKNELSNGYLLFPDPVMQKVMYMVSAWHSNALEQPLPSDGAVWTVPMVPAPIRILK